MPVHVRADPPVVQSRAQWVDRLDELHLLTPLRILLIIVVAIVITMVLRVVVSRVLRRTLTLTVSDRPRAEARQRALASALRSGVIGVVWATAVITIISELGVNIGGVIATATIIGGAIAFGAQTLIRDVIAGMFVLAEDQYGVGDSVDIGYARGEVERITLRSVRLRDSEGRVWHVAHGNVMSVANLSKSSQALLDVEVSRDSALDVVEQTAAHLGQRLGQMPAVATLITGPTVPVGLIDVRDDRLVYRVAVPTLPGRQDDVRRVWRGLVLQAFREGSLRQPGPVATSPGAAAPPAE